MSNGVGGVGSANNYYNQYENNVQTAAASAEESAVQELLENPVDTYTPSYTVPKNAKDPEAIEKLWNDTYKEAETLRKMVSKLLGKEDSNSQGFWAVRADGNFELSEADKAKAQEMIGEDGFFGVKKTSERIMNFAKALVGEDASEEDIDKMRDAVQKGFDDVAKMFGGFDNLPDVTKKTHEAVMKSFDDWKAGGADKTEGVTTTA